MFSTAINMAQLITFLIPGFVLLLLTKHYFPFLESVWGDFHSGSGNVTVAIIEVLLFSLAYGITLFSVTFTLSIKYIRRRIKKRGIRIKAVFMMDSDHHLTSLRNLFQIHQMMFKMFIIGFIALIAIKFSPDIPESPNNAIRYLITSIFIFFTGAASLISANQIVTIINVICMNIDSDTVANNQDTTDIVVQGVDG